MPVPDPKSIIRRSRAEGMGYGWDVSCPCGWESWQPLPHLALSAAEVHVKLRHGEDEDGSGTEGDPMTTDNDGSPSESEG